MNIRIDFACNDPDNGVFAHAVSAVHLPDGALELTAKQWGILSYRGCPRLRAEGDRIVLSGKHWPILSSHEWLGNWCWNGYVMSAETAQQFFSWLHRRNSFRCEGGWSDLCDLWETSPPLSADFIRTLLA